MMKNYDKLVEIQIGLIFNHPYSILIIGGSGSRKTNVLVNLITNQRPDIEKTDLYVKDLFESK